MSCVIMVLLLLRKNLKAVCLVIDSRDGSLLESKMIFDYIKMKKEATKVGLGEARSTVPVYAFITNYATAGGYMVACAADKIFGHEFSVVGNIKTPTGENWEEMAEVVQKFDGQFFELVKSCIFYLN